LHQRNECWQQLSPFRREPVALASALPRAPIILALEQAVNYELAQPSGGYLFADPGALGELAEAGCAAEGLARRVSRRISSAERLPITSSA
jgi:hypothetical protein